MTASRQGKHGFRGATLARIAGTAGVALAVLLVLRTQVAQRYLIPSRSMEPTLHGDEKRGDIVLVDKSGLVRSHSPSALRRFDIVVVHDSEKPDGDPLVKRVGSMGNELLRIADGDIFVRSLDGTPWERVQKDPIEHRDLRFTFFEQRAGIAPISPVAHYLDGVLGDDGAIELTAIAASAADALAMVAAADPAVEPSRLLRSRLPIDTSFIDAEGRRSSAGTRCSNDIGVELDLELTDACRGVVLALSLHEQVMALVCDRRGQIVWHQQEGDVQTECALAARVSLAFGYLDGRVFLEVDGKLVAMVAWPLPTHTISDRNAVRFAVLGDGKEASARATRVRLFHDVFYEAENRPGVGLREYRVEPDQVFLLGDNTFDSRDSRLHGAYAAADVVGRPLAVIGPWRRIRWLPR